MTNRHWAVGDVAFSDSSLLSLKSGATHQADNLNKTVLHWSVAHRQPIAGQSQYSM